MSLNDSELVRDTDKFKILIAKYNKIKLQIFFIVFILEGYSICSSSLEQNKKSQPKPRCGLKSKTRKYIIFFYMIHVMVLLLLLISQQFLKIISTTSKSTSCKAMPYYCHISCQNQWDFIRLQLTVQPIQVSSHQKIDPCILQLMQKLQTKVNLINVQKLIKPHVKF